MELRAIVGGDVAKKQKILAADGLAGIVIMLSYYAGGTNLFPSVIDPRVYMLPLDDSRFPRSCIRTDLELLSKLQDQLEGFLKQKFGNLSVSSVPVYLCKLRQGFRANRQGPLPPIDVKYSAATQELVIPPRDFEKDYADGTANFIPSWIRFS